MLKIFAIIEVVLKAFEAWEQFLDWLDSKHRADLEVRRQKRDKAIEDSLKAGTDGDIWDSQDSIIDQRPRP